MPESAQPVDGGSLEPDATPACEDVVAAAPEHHPAGFEYGNGGVDGAGCLGQCRNGVAGPTFTIGGSLWNRRLEGGDPIAGGVVYVIDGADQVIRMVTNDAGHFWYRNPITLPLRTYATGCPDSIPMVANTTGNCSAGGACHGRDNKIFLTNVAPLLSE